MAAAWRGGIIAAAARGENVSWMWSERHLSVAEKGSGRGSLRPASGGRGSAAAGVKSMA